MPNNNYSMFDGLIFDAKTENSQRVRDDQWLIRRSTSQPGCLVIEQKDHGPRLFALTEEGWCLVINPRPGTFEKITQTTENMLDKFIMLINRIMGSYSGLPGRKFLLEDLCLPDTSLLAQIKESLLKLAKDEQVGEKDEPRRPKTPHPPSSPPPASSPLPPSSSPTPLLGIKPGEDLNAYKARLLYLKRHHDRTGVVINVPLEQALQSCGLLEPEVMAPVLADNKVGEKAEPRRPKTPHPPSSPPPASLQLPPSSPPTPLPDGLADDIRVAEEALYDDQKAKRLEDHKKSLLFAMELNGKMGIRDLNVERALKGLTASDTASENRYTLFNSSDSTDPGSESKEVNNRAPSRK